MSKSTSLAITLSCVLLMACGGGGGGGESGGGGANPSGTNSVVDSATTSPTSPTSPTSSPDTGAEPNLGQFAAAFAVVPADGATISGTVRIEVRGRGLANVELLPPTGYTPVYGTFRVSADGTLAWLDLNTSSRADGALAVRVSAFDLPAGQAGAREIVVGTRTWQIRNTTASSAPSAGIDPLFSRQWHLKNTGQAGALSTLAKPGEDINVEPVWTSCNDNGSCKGENITIAVVDRGMEIAHKDIQPNISSRLNHRVYSLTATPVNGNPTPTGTDEIEAHGTVVGGTIAARDNNGLGGRGVAPRASLVSYSLIGASTTDNKVDAMTYQAADVAVSNNSWGPPDGTGRLQYAPSLWRNAIDYGLANGRNGRGTIYVWAAGNGGYETYPDSANYDGYANYRGVIAVNSMNAQGKASVYSEFGANIWVTAPGGESCRTSLGITTTDFSGIAGINIGNISNDLSDSDYTQCVAGTSISAPIVSGVVALMLQANPALTWRDVRTILARTARQNDPTDLLWSTNSAGRRIHYLNGFGAVNAMAAVDAARNWTNLPAQRSYMSPVQSVNRAIPDNNATGVSSSITISNSGIRNIEWIDVTFNANNHTYAGDLQIVLTAPSGTTSVLALRRLCENDLCGIYDNWRFGIARHLDEPADGVWRITASDLTVEDVGTFQSWQITVFGH